MKGLAKSVRVWRLERLSTGAGSTRGVFVGRKAELELFSGILTACRNGQTGHVIFVRGEAGIGKTRLLEEMARIAEEQGFISHRGLFLDFGAGKGQDAVRAIVRSLLGLDQGGAEEVRRLAAERVFAEGLVAPDRTVFLSVLLDLPQSTAMRASYDAMDNSARRRGKREVAAAIVRGMSKRCPILIAVEDLHWADQLAVSHLAEIAAAIESSPAALIITSRIDGDPIGPAWRAGIGSTPFTTLDVGPLHRDEALALAAAFSGAPKRVALACVERAEGNPLFLEQLLRNAEDGADGVPASIQSLTLARADRLTAIGKRALQAASVIGQRFDLAALRYLLEEPHYTCAELIEHVLVRPDGEAYLFAHALIQEGVYSSLLKGRRSDLHRRAAEWFAKRDPMLRAQHLDRAQDASASEAYRTAAEAEKAGYRYERALQLVERGLAVARVENDLQTLMGLKRALLYELGATPETMESIEVSGRALAAAHDELDRWHAATRAGVGYLRPGG